MHRCWDRGLSPRAGVRVLPGAAAGGDGDAGEGFGVPVSFLGTWWLRGEVVGELGRGDSPGAGGSWDGGDAEVPLLQMLSCVPGRDSARTGLARADTLWRGAEDGRGRASILTRCFSSSVFLHFFCRRENLLPALRAAECPSDTLAPESSEKGENLLSLPS